MQASNHRGRCTPSAQASAKASQPSLCVDRQELSEARRGQRTCHCIDLDMTTLLLLEGSLINPHPMLRKCWTPASPSHGCEPYWRWTAPASHFGSLLALCSGHRNAPEPWCTGKVVLTNVHRPAAALPSTRTWSSGRLHDARVTSASLGTAKSPRNERGVSN